MLFVSTHLWPTATHAHLPVHVRGAAQIETELRVEPAGGYAIVRGSVRDELGAPIALARLSFTAEVSSPKAGTSGELSVAACATSGSEKEVRTAHVETDPDGRFCARLSKDQLSQATALQVVFAGSPSYVGFTKQLTLDDTREGVLVDVDQVQRRANLDEAEWTVIAQLQPLEPMRAVDRAKLSLELSLASADEGTKGPSTLRRVEMQLGVPTRITLPTKLLGRPGPAQLIFTFDGNASYRPLRSQVGIERFTSVRLESADSPLHTQAGARLSGSIRARSGIGLPPPGWIQVSGLDATATVVPLDPDGNAEFVIATPRNQNQGTITLVYQPRNAGWQAAGPLQLPVHLTPPSKWPVAAWSAIALLVLAWFGWSRRRGEPESLIEAASTTSPRPYAHLEIVSAADSPDAGWSGVVVDAHEGTVVTGAVIELCRPGFAREEVVLSVRSNDEGAFSIPAHETEKQKTYRLLIRARNFAKLALALPPPGHVKVYVVSTRRALLERLVSWTKRRGHPFDSKAEPTPDWVAEVAHSKRQPEVEAWAKAVSNAAFGATPPVDAEQPDLTPPAGTLGAWAGAKRSNE